MNNTIKTLQNHRTFRHFAENFTMPKADVDAILQSAQQAPSWMNGQHYSIIRITDSDVRAQIGAWQPKNPQIISASEFWVFVADLHRMALASQAYGESATAPAFAQTDTLITVVTDAALAAENALIAAESLGYGGCFIGSIRANAAELVKLLALPPLTFPVFGLCLGKADIEMKLKPRLPQRAIIFENRYQPDLDDVLAEYEQTMSDFGEAREIFPWREKFARYYARKGGDENDALLQTQGFLKKNS